MDTTGRLAPGSRLEIPIRAPHFDFSDVPHHWLAGNAVATHVFNGMNLVFPDGERFFIQAVREHLPQLEDEALVRQVRGFFGQEGRHAYEHERYFEALEAQGYDLEGFLRRFRGFMKTSERWLPASVRLSMTAGAEHYTATFGSLALEYAPLEKAHPSLRRLIAWHATEEIEHKAVAFDVLQATHPSYALRLLGFGLATVSLFGWTIAGTRMLLRQDRAAGRTTRAEVRRMRRALRRAGDLDVRRLLTRVADYLRRDFHPNDLDDLELAHAKLRELGLEAV
ncbi:MAG: metal-dependent hydrolase [Proteobacteria bacterium]|nr:metal-dependent hydrolase [Pseudomonadota bacterium]